MMIDFLTTYWLALVSTALTGLYLLGVLKKARDAKAARPVPAPIVIERK